MDRLMQEARTFTIVAMLGTILGVGAINADNKKIIDKQEATIKQLNELQEGLIKGEGYTVTRQENTDTVRYLVGSCVKKEVQMFAPVGDT